MQMLMICETILCIDSSSPIPLTSPLSFFGMRTKTPIVKAVGIIPLKQSWIIVTIDFH